MKNRGVFSLFTLILVILGLFTTCADTSDSGSPDSKYTVVPGDTLYAKLQWLGTNAASNSGYILEIAADETLGSQSLSYSGKSNITIQLKGIESPKTIFLRNDVSLFSIENGVTLILKENIILSMSENIYVSPSIIEVKFGGKLVMNQGAKIIGSKTVSGVRVYGGTFTMSGGEISGNTANSSGGGVYVGGGTFTMSSGEISGNTAPSGGGGVNVAAGTFVMSGGKISDNIARNSNGGGVYVGDYGTFTMSGGEISGNTANNGGGVYVSGYSSNTLINYEVHRGTFTMRGGEISGNISSVNGGGVYVAGGNFSGTSKPGGGVVESGGIFTKSGGTITGYTSDMVNGNVVKNSSGVVKENQGHTAYDVSVSGSSLRRRETTAGPKVNMKSGLNGATGGWE